MTVSGSGRTREKDTRAPARGPFCVLGSSLAGEEDVLLQGACCPSGALLSVCMPVARPIYAARRGDSHPFRCLRTAVHQPGACISYALSGKFGAPRQHSLCTHMPVRKSSPRPLNTIKQPSTDLCRPLSVMTCQQGGFHGMDGLCLCGILSFFNKARFIMKLLEKARAAG